MHRKQELSQVTEDDVNEVKGDISTLRFELLDVFKNNGMDISSANKNAKGWQGWQFTITKNLHFPKRNTFPVWCYVNNFIQFNLFPVALSRKMRIWERRLLRNFQIVSVAGTGVEGGENGEKGLGDQPKDSEADKCLKLADCVVVAMDTARQLQ